MRAEVRNRLAMLKADIVAEVPASQPDRRAWMMLQAVADGGVLLVESETPADVTPDDYLSPEQILTHVETHYLTIDEAIAALHDRGIDSDNFDVPWNTDCPF